MDPSEYAQLMTHHHRVEAEVVARTEEDADRSEESSSKCNYSFGFAA
jgi:hypothetical protein